MDEATWISDARRGDLNAFNQLVLKYQGVVYNTAYRILGDVDGAADATQEAFISAHLALGGYRGGSFRAWLLRIVTNACYDYLRYKQRRPGSSLEAATERGAVGYDSLVATTVEPEEYALRSELSDLLQAGINSLPAEQRIILVLADVQGFSYQEIAEMTGTSLGTVKSRLSRGRAKLRDYLLLRKELLPAKYRLNDREGLSTEVGGSV
jgi:RNA polymerase sigma-70 factor (ECF subfamily)